MRILLFGLAALALVSAGPAGAWQPTEDYPPTEEQEPQSSPRSERPRTAGGKCQSSAGDIETAKEFCEGQLDCASKGLTIKCGGRPNNYSCKCV